MSAFADSLHDARLIERNIAQMNKYQNDFITGRFRLCGKIDLLFCSKKEYLIQMIGFADGVWLS